MSSPIAIHRASSPSASSSSSSSASSSGSLMSSSSSSSSNILSYTREELLSLATSPLAQTRAPAPLHSFPQILRKRRRGVLEAYQALDYARNVTTPEVSRDGRPEDFRSGNSSPSHSRSGSSTRTHSRSHSRGSTHDTASLPSQSLSLQQPTPVPVPVWRANVYVPPARRAAPEQRARPGRDARTWSARTWSSPAPARAILA